MKSFLQHISEAQATVSAIRELVGIVNYPFAKPHAGWWNCKTKKGMTFVWKYTPPANFHITQVVRDPKFFGVKINLDPKYVNDVLDGKSDNNAEINEMMWDKGWVKTDNGHGQLSIETNTERFARETIGDVTAHYAPNSKLNVVVRIDTLRELTFSDYGSLERFYKYGTSPRERIYR